jgi:hypothetical protein
VPRVKLVTVIGEEAPDAPMTFPELSLAEAKYSVIAEPPTSVGAVNAIDKLVLLATDAVPIVGASGAFSPS